MPFSVIFFVVFSITPLFPAFGAPVNRNILAVIDGSEIREDFDNRIFKWAEMPLNYLGFKVDYVDVSKHLPTDQEMTKYFGIISWFTDNQLKGAADYANWLTKQLGKGKKLLILDDFGFDADEKNKPTPEAVMDKFFNAFRISFDGSETTNSPLLIEITYNDPKMTEFERPLKGELTNFENLKVLDKNAKVYLKLKRKDNGIKCDAVFVHSKGGFVLTDYAAYLNPGDYQSRWKINPFIFFKEVFKADFPKPDSTTLNGMRLFYSQIDGDGIRNMSYTDKKTPCGELVFDQLMTKYNLPITASIVVGDILMSVGGEKERLTSTIKKMFKLPNVEPASHGWAHPYTWRLGDKSSMGMRTTGYKYTPQNEIGNALDYINKNLVPPDKKAKILLWTGDCEPDYGALKYVYDHNIYDLNGGDTRFDDHFPSYTYVAPIFRNVDGLRQHLASASNEIPYTNEWTGPYYGIKFVINTFKNTERPIRLTPVDVYYHFYVMEYQEAIDAIKSAYEWSLTQEIAPVFTSEYVQIANGFLSTNINKLSPTNWLITDNNNLMTIRFDNNKSYVDLAKSQGVLGFLHYQNSLYVHLDNGKKSQVVLTSQRPTRPYLVKANGHVKEFKLNAQSAKVAFKLNTVGRVNFTIGGMVKEKEYSIKINNMPFMVKADANGEISILEEILGNKYEWVNVIIN
ncbi:MAG: hypothetical protein ABIE74_06345 [Pseudomonadota bacterium]